MPDRHQNQHPRYTQYTNSQQRNNHWNQRIAGTFNGTRKDLNRDIGKVESDHIKNHFFTDLITFSSLVNNPSVYRSVNNNNMDNTMVIPIAIAIDTRTLFLTRSYLPAPKFCPTNVVTIRISINRHPVKRIDLPNGRPAGDYVGSKAINARLDQDVGDRIHGGLEAQPEGQFSAWI